MYKRQTLLRVIAGEQTPDEGTVSLPGSVALLAQELPYPDDAPISRVLDDAQHDAVDTLERLETLGAALGERPDDPAVAEAYAEALEMAEQTGAWNAEAARGETMNGLGLGGMAETLSLIHI